MPNETLTITDNRTGTTYTLPIYKDAIRAIDQIGRASCRERV